MVGAMLAGTRRLKTLRHLVDIAGELGVAPSDPYLSAVGAQHSSTSRINLLVRRFFGHRNTETTLRIP
jgi:hypothetical protein